MADVTPFKYTVMDRATRPSNLTERLGEFNLQIMAIFSSSQSKIPSRQKVIRAEQLLVKK